MTISDTDEYKVAISEIDVYPVILIDQIITFQE